MSVHDSPPSLVPLFARLERRDPDAVNDILKHCQNRLKALTRRMLRIFPNVRTGYDTSDVYGEASLRFVLLLRNVPLEAPTDFLCLAAENIRQTLVDLTRRRKVVGVAVGGDDAFDPSDDDTNDPELLAMWQEFHETVAKLPHDDRVLFDLLYYQDLSLPDASALLGVPYPTLKLRWQNARVRLALRFHNLPPV